MINCCIASRAAASSCWSAGRRADRQDAALPVDLAGNDLEARERHPRSVSMVVEHLRHDALGLRENVPDLDGVRILRDVVPTGLGEAVARNPLAHGGRHRVEPEVPVSAVLDFGEHRLVRVEPKKGDVEREIAGYRCIEVTRQWSRSLRRSTTCAATATS